MKPIDMVFIKPFHMSGDEGGAIDTNKRIHYVSVTGLIRGAKHEGMTFEKRFMHSVSHEIIHQIIYDILDDDDSWDFDHICYDKYNQMKYWIGGVGATKEGGKI